MAWPFSDPGFIHDTGRLPFHRMLGRTNGDLCGRLVFDLENEIPLVNGSLVWRHLAKATATFMPVQGCRRLSLHSTQIVPARAHPS